MTNKISIGSKVWANPLGNIGGTTKGVVVRYNDIDQVIIRNTATVQEEAWHQANVHISEVA